MSSFDPILYALWKKSHGGGNGSDGSSAVSHYRVIEQKNASEIWEIRHDMDCYPNVTVIDSGENVVYGDVFYVDLNNIKITFSVPFSGKVIFN